MSLNDVWLHFCCYYNIVYKEGPCDAVDLCGSCFSRYDSLSFTLATYCAHFEISIVHHRLLGGLSADQQFVARRFFGRHHERRHSTVCV